MFNSADRLVPKFRLMISVFPIVLGTVLAGLGTLKLSEATVVLVKPWTAPYGLLLFGSVAEIGQWGFRVKGISLDENRGALELEATLRGSMSGEVVIAMRIPYNVTLEQVNRLEGCNSKGESFPVQAKEVKVASLKPSGSLVYARLSVPEGTESCTIDLILGWKGFVIREEFSTYTIIIPVSYVGSVDDEIHKLLPEQVQAYYGSCLSKVEVTLMIPERADVKRTYPPVAEEVTHAGTEVREFRWAFDSEGTSMRTSLEEWVTGEGIEWRTGEASASFSVSFDVPEKREAKDRLLFDSGLYLGLGVSLVISGIYEALKARTEKTG